jgi:hypothetical protein
MKKLLYLISMCALSAHAQFSVKELYIETSTREVIKGDTVKYRVRVQNELPTSTVEVTVWSVLAPTVYSTKDTLVLSKLQSSAAGDGTTWYFASFVSKETVNYGLQGVSVNRATSGALRQFININEPLGFEDESFTSSAKVVAMYDLQGRAVEVPEVSKVVIAVYSDGRRRKIRIADLKD